MATMPDAALAGALREGRVILGYGLTFDAAPRVQSACVLQPISIAIVQPPDAATYEPLFHATGAVCNLPRLAEAAATSGFLNAAPDSDGILGRVPLLAELDGRIYPGLALAAVAAATGARDMALRIANVNASVLTIDDRTVPVDGKGNLLLRYRGKKRTFPYFSAADVLTDQIPAGGVRGKVGVVGPTALGPAEGGAPPLATLFAGGEVQERGGQTRQAESRKDRGPAFEGAGSPAPSRSKSRRDWPYPAPDPTVRPPARGATRPAA